MNGLETVALLEPLKYDERADQIHMGTGSCTLCDCPRFIPNSSGQLCANQNSQGGTCTHWNTEHR